MSARDRALSCFINRIDFTAQREQFRQVIEQPSLYAGEGEIRPLGAAGGIPPRSNQSTGSLAVGQPVAASQGLMQGIPNAVQAPELQAAVSDIKALVDLIRKAIGIQVAEGDPNTTPAYARYPYDQYWDASGGRLYYWQPGTDADPGEWVEMPLGPALVLLNGDPNRTEHPWQANTIYVDTTNFRLFVSNPDGDPDGLNAALKWFRVTSKTFSGSLPDMVYPGDIYQGADGLISILSASGGWVSQWYCPSCTEQPDPPPGDPDALDSVYFTEDGVTYYWQDGVCTNCV
jgi:hypothetical protein